MAGRQREGTSYQLEKTVHSLTQAVTDTEGDLPQPMPGSWQFTRSSAGCAMSSSNTCHWQTSSSRLRVCSRATCPAPLRCEGWTMERLFPSP